MGENASVFMLARLEFKWEMLVGSFTVWSMVFNLMVIFQVTRQLEILMIAFQPSSVRLELVSMCQEQSSWTWSQVLWMKSELALTSNFFILSKWSVARRMQPIIMLGGITLLARR